MEHALDLARKGVGLASPNPTVGCVIVKDGAILGEGFHQYDWKDHAEIMALKQAGDRARGATLYVTLEPCNHTGRTGPCTEAIIAAGISRVVAAIEDRIRNARDRFARLWTAGISSKWLLETEAQSLNAASPLVTTRSRSPGKVGNAGQVTRPAKRANQNRLITSE
jgi:diaminohydroxyphosphoribosylaminopyrimidine deaminase/5-amino-6-(5-phosphoribosylamino)uracil reductase